MKKNILYLLLILFIVFGVWFSSKNPSNTRSWSKDQKVLTFAEFNDDIITVRNIRNNTYRTVDDYEVGYYDDVFKLSELNSVDFMVEPFSGYKGPAHTLLSFGFLTEANQKRYIVISVEVRKEIGESFSPLNGLFRQYELQYVAASEQDAIKLRSNYRKDDVYLYPIKTTQDKMQQLFVSMLTRMNSLKDNPEFYNTITSTCTTNIVDHVNEITPERIPFSYKVLLPGYSDELAYDIGLIDTELPFEQAKEFFKINTLAEKNTDPETFSYEIRQGR